MPTLTFVLSTGERREFAIQEPASAMHVARLNGVRGIEAECGGVLSCGTCHVYVDDADVSKLPLASEQENDMLELVAADRKPTSRLCCQIHLSDQTDCLVLHIPATQF
ncbi:2Fe-2S iron-sulfur cluster-binding protein [Caballeronia sp. 15711]|uniref:2Fe-2S iron-sulfur cluster-binding protein n=1 Tax=Caballeronia sp. 15711 TaxID=3391029 RepID=UPI0039E664AA